MSDGLELLTREELIQQLRHDATMRRVRAGPVDDSLHCVCVTPRPHRAALFLRIVGTVECAGCGRAIFTADGTPVREL